MGLMTYELAWQVGPEANGLLKGENELRVARG